MRSVFGHHSGHDVLEEVEKVLVSDAWFKWDVEGVVFAIVFAYLMEGTCAWEEFLSVLMEGDGHAAVGEVEGLFHSISVVNVDVQIQHSRVHL
jgi:hypothetical protein